MNHQFYQDGTVGITFDPTPKLTLKELQTLIWELQQVEVHLIHANEQRALAIKKGIHD